MQKRKARLFALAFGLVLILMLSSAIITYTFFKKDTGLSVAKVKSGLVASDSLRNGNLDRHYLRWADSHGWNFDQFNIQEWNSDFFEDPVNGLNLGMKAEVEGKWGGMFATAINNNASLFHVNITTPYESVGNELNTGLKVATSHGPISYVSCTANSDPSGITWLVQHSKGDLQKATEFETLWTSNDSINQPLSRECTIITNGDNYLKVYLDRALVFASDKLNLTMSRPFLVFLEVDTPSASQLWYGTFNDYYSTTSDKIKFINAPSYGLVRLTDTQSDQTIEEEIVGANGVADIDIGQYHFPLYAQIQLYDTKNDLVASTPSRVGIFGGDVYSMTK